MPASSATDTVTRGSSVERDAAALGLGNTAESERVITRAQASQLAREASGAAAERDGRLVCGICGKSFVGKSRVGNLRKHCHNHTGVRVRCRLCGKSQIRHDEMHRHVRNRHGKDQRVAKTPGGRIRTEDIEAHLVVVQGPRPPPPPPP